VSGRRFLSPEHSMAQSYNEEDATLVN
jgi:hypothetical protein